MKNIFRITFIALFINITCLNGVIPDVLGNTRDSNTIQNSRTKMVSNLNKLSDPEKEIVYFYDKHKTDLPLPLHPNIGIVEAISGDIKAFEDLMTSYLQKYSLNNVDNIKLRYLIRSYGVPLRMELLRSYDFVKEKKINDFSIDIQTYILFNELMTPKNELYKYSCKFYEELKIDHSMLPVMTIVFYRNNDVERFKIALKELLAMPTYNFNEANTKFYALINTLQLEDAKNLLMKMQKEFASDPEMKKGYHLLEKSLKTMRPEFDIILNINVDL